MLDPNAPYDKSKETPTDNQSNLARAHFEMGQAVRRELSAQDADSPNKLTPGEVLALVATNSPGIAAAYVAALNDDNSDVDDFITASHLVAQQYL